MKVANLHIILTLIADFCSYYSSHANYSVIFYDDVSVFSLDSALISIA